LLGSIADKIDQFIAKYPSYNFYDYYQIIRLRDIPYPFRLVKNIQIDSKTIGARTIAIYATIVTDQLFSDYKEYANMDFIESIYWASKGAYESSRNSYLVGRGLFDGKGFADKAFAVMGKYETYKIALALYVSKFLNYASDVEVFKTILNSISPFATLYTEIFNGVGDLNAETAALTILALSDDPYRFSPPSPAISSPPSAPEIATIGVAAIIEMLLIYLVIKRYLSTIEKYR
jgi:hypothetical protein